MIAEVSLYFWGDSLVPDEITKSLGVNPTYCQTKGDTRITSTGKVVVAKIGTWCFASGGHIDSNTLSDHISFLLSTFEHCWSLLPSLQNVQESCIDLYVIDLVEFKYKTEFTVEQIEKFSLSGLPVRFTIDLPTQDDLMESGDAIPIS